MAEPEQILELTQAVDRVVTDKIKTIKDITRTTRILSLNALIEASRAGAAGRGFAVVANEVKNVSESINEVTASLEGELAGTIRELMGLGQSLIRQLRGSRLNDLALNMIDLIDRNLYERSCDVRWWATDSAVVDCLTRHDAEAVAYASKRLGVILASYTVYLDLWVADAQGRVIATGRPERYPRAIGTDVSHTSWFRNAIATHSGEDYAVEDISPVPALDNALTATYATAVRERGMAEGRPIGALGIFFDWSPQAQTVVENVRLTEQERSVTRCLLIDQNHRVIAASDHAGILEETFPLDTGRNDSGSVVDDKGRIVGYALTPGYETYRGLGWYGVVIQQIPQTVH